jgi:hypothetical protein
VTGLASIGATGDITGKCMHQYRALTTSWQANQSRARVAPHQVGQGAMAYVGDR